MKILDINNIKYKIRGKTVLEGISLDIKRGESISLVGESGSGKSTLLKILSDLISPDEGEILYKYKKYEEFNPGDIRKQISYCVQLPFLFGKIVEENFKFIFEIRKENYDRNRVLAVLKEFKITEDFLNKPIESLSGGEKQRIAIARNMVFKPEILLLDEATSALDNDNTLIVENYIKKLNDDGVTVIWVTHSVEQSYRIFNKRITMKNGKIENIEILKAKAVLV
ncbi:MAG: ABC transporter ATP-binding protein [Sarcina sp.]